MQSRHGTQDYYIIVKLVRRSPGAHGHPLSERPARPGSDGDVDAWNRSVTSPEVQADPLQATEAHRRRKRRRLA